MDGLLMENPLKMDDLGGKPTIFRKHPSFGWTSLNRVCPYKPSILGYHDFWKHPYLFIFSLDFRSDFIQEACSWFWSTPIEEVSIAPQKIQEPISSPEPKNPEKVPGCLGKARGKTPEISWNSPFFKTEKTSGRNNCDSDSLHGKSTNATIESFYAVFRWIIRVIETQRNTPVLFLGSGIQWDPPICSGGKILKLLRRFRNHPLKKAYESFSRTTTECFS